MNLKISQRAFSLIEVLITISVIAVVAVAITTSLSAVQTSSRDTQRQADLNAIKSALQQYYADVNKYPNSLVTHLANGSPLTNCSGRATPCTVTKTYLNKLPKDPNGAAYYYRSYVDDIANSCGFSGGGENGSEVGVCHKYVLCAKMENPPADGTCFDAGYNFTITPL